MNKHEIERLKIYICFIIIAILVAALVLSLVRNASAGYDLYGPVQGYSMAPTILPGDYVGIRKTNDKPNVGDIVIYESYDIELGRKELVVHRVKEVYTFPDGTGWIASAKGDNNQGNDFFSVMPTNMVGIGLYRVTMWKPLQ